jgi:hypothetical protein
MKPENLTTSLNQQQVPGQEQYGPVEHVFGVYDQRLQAAANIDGL